MSARFARDRDFYLENGRLYHRWRPGTCLFPHDQFEIDRLDMLNNVFYDSSLLGMPLFSSRLQPASRQPLRILDVGCGTAYWVYDMAKQYPDADIYGLDIAAIHEYTQGREPRNITWRIPQDFERDWDFQEDIFDLVHMQMLCGSISDLYSLYRKAFRHLRPRYGFIEHIEIDFRPQCRDGTLSESSRFRRWFDKLDEASRVWQKPIAYDPSATEAALQRAGFVDIQRTTYELPFTVRWSGSNETPVPAAQLYRASFENGGLEGMCMAQLTRPLPENDRSRARSWNRGLMTPDEVEYLADQVRAEMRDPRKHVYNVVWVWRARRPSNR